MLSLCTHGPRGRSPMSVVGLAAIAGVAVSSAHATDWLEPRINDQDAAEFWQEAQVPLGIGELESITGRLDGVFEGPGFGAPPGVPDYQDMFLISIPIPSLFSARTVPFGFEDIDTELFLFSVTGQGLLNNDNEFAPPIFFSKITPNATDGTFNLIAPGNYVIGVAGSGNVPTSGGLAIFDKATSSLEISGPDGPGGAGVHDGWITNEISGRYVIELTGAAYVVPAPGAGAIGLLGLMALGRRRR